MWHLWKSPGFFPSFPLHTFTYFPCRPADGILFGKKKLCGVWSPCTNLWCCKMFGCAWEEKDYFIVLNSADRISWLCRSVYSARGGKKSPVTWLKQTQTTATVTGGISHVSAASHTTRNHLLQTDSKSGQYILEHEVHCYSQRQHTLPPLTDFLVLVFPFSPELLVLLLVYLVYHYLLKDEVACQENLLIGS